MRKTVFYLLFLLLSSTCSAYANPYICAALLTDFINIEFKNPHVPYNFITVSNDIVLNENDLPVALAHYQQLEPELAMTWNNSRLKGLQWNPLLPGAETRLRAWLNTGHGVGLARDKAAPSALVIAIAMNQILRGQIVKLEKHNGGIIEDQLYAVDFGAPGLTPKELTVVFEHDGYYDLREFTHKSLSDAFALSLSARIKN